MSTLSVESLKIAVRTPRPGSLSLTPRRDTPSLEGNIVGRRFSGQRHYPALAGSDRVDRWARNGKSTAIESLRYVLGLTPIGASAKADHDAIVSGVLRAGTVVRLAVEATSPMIQAFTIERSVHNTPVVKDSSGTVTSLQPADVIGDVEIFGQHELAELTSDSAKVASMLHRFQGNGDLTAEHKATLATLKESREKLARAEKDKAELEEELADIPRLDEQVRQFQETDVPTRLSEITRMKQDEAVFSEGHSRVADAKSTLTGLTDTQLTAKLGASYDGLEGSPQADTLQLVRSATNTLAETLKTLATQAEAAIAAADAAIASAETDWTNAVREQRDDHAEVLRKLVQDGLEPDKYLTTTKALEGLKAKEPRRAGIDANIKELVASRKTLLQELAEHEIKRAEALHDAIRTANAATGGVVIVKPIAAQDRRHVKSLIEDTISGQRTQIMAAVDAEGFSTRAFVEAARKGEAELTAKFSIRGAQARGVVDAGKLSSARSKSCRSGMRWRYSSTSGRERARGSSRRWTTYQGTAGHRPAAAPARSITCPTRH